MPRLALHFERRPDGRLLGTLDSPDQGAMGLPLDSVTFVRDSLRCEFRAAQAVYAARLSAGGDSLIGTWTQAGVGLPLTFTRGRFAPPRRPQEPVPPYPYDTLAVAFINPNAAGVRLSGTLTLPKGKGPFPAALLITGSGQQDRDETAFEHRPFKVLADHLTRNGIAVLRVDDRGVGGSTGPIATATSEDFASDALASVEYLARRAEVRKDAVGLIGHSEGGLIAPLVAWRAKQVSFVVLLAGPGIPCDSLMLLQTAASRRAIGVTEAQLAKEKVAGRRLYAAIRAADSSGVVAATRELVTVQLSALPEPERAGAGDPATLAAGAVQQLWNPWMRYFVSYDPAAALHRVRCPVLALNGSRDLQVTPRENLAGIEAALKHGGNKDFTVRELPGLNHLFQTCRTCTLAEYVMLEETFAPAALESISTWIQERVGRRK